jgi:hypothetical protein
MTGLDQVCLNPSSLILTAASARDQSAPRKFELLLPRPLITGLNESGLW